MAMSTMDNASAQLAIALQLHDLDELEGSGAVDTFVIRLQRQQLEVDLGFDAVSFEASRRLALSMAKAVGDDSALLAQSTRLPRIDNATFDRLALLNHPPPASSGVDELALQPKNAEGTLSSKAESQKRVRSLIPKDGPSLASVKSKEAEPSHHSHAAMDQKGQSHKRERGEQIITEERPMNQIEGKEKSSVKDPKTSTADVSAAQVAKETAPLAVIETSASTADCASCGDHLTIDKLVKVSCKHYYCKDCFSQFIEASIQRVDGFPPKCCKIPITFITVASNVSAALLSSYSKEQAKIKNVTPLYCGIQGCGVRIEKDRIDGVRATCKSCGRDTCTRCRGEYPRRVNGRNVGHVCKKDKAHEQVLALAKQEGCRLVISVGT